MKDIYYQVDVSFNDSQYTQEIKDIEQVEGYIQFHLNRLEDKNKEDELYIRISKKSDMIKDMLE